MYAIHYTNYGGLHKFAKLTVVAAGVATSKLFSLKEYQNARRIGVYLSMPSGELSTTSIVQDALTKGKEVFIPYIYTVEPPEMLPKTSVMDMLALESMEEFESLEPDKWGIPSLKKDQVHSKKNCFGGRGLTFPAEEQTTAHDSQGLDLIVMPGMAFDQGFRRLGHGKGYYDHFLTRYSTKETNGKPVAAAPKMPFLGKKNLLRPSMKHSRQWKQDKEKVQAEKKHHLTPLNRSCPRPPGTNASPVRRNSRYTS